MEDKTLLIREKIREKYNQVALTPKGSFNYPTGLEGLKGLGYNLNLISLFPEEVLDNFCGVGNPFSLGPLPEKGIILDIGCGAGIDAFIAAQIVGKEGRVYGLDLSLPMVKKARENLKKLALKNVYFLVGVGEELPFPAHSLDGLISNGVFNLTLNKEKALREAFRVLKKDGLFLLADMSLEESLPPEALENLDTWSN